MYWRRPAIRGEGMSLWLRTLAVEGGFPARALEGDGWASIYLARVVADLLSQDGDTDDAALVAAERQSGYAARAYRQSIFYAVAADLALAIVGLRRKADANTQDRDLPTSVRLDLIDPGWRADLPIHLEPTVTAALVDGLLAVEKFTTAGGVLGCERLLMRSGSDWRPAIRLALDGISAGSIEKGLPRSPERLRAFPGGELARFVSGELAVFEPPGEVGEGWRVRPSRREMVFRGVPLTTNVSLDLQSNGRSILQVPWPGGESVRAPLTVFGLESGDDALVLLGSGSGGYGPDELAVLVPAEAKLTNEPGGYSEPVDGRVDDGATLWCVRGAARIEMADGDVYRVAAGQAGAQRDRLLVSGETVVGLASGDPIVELLAGRPAITVCEGRNARSPRSKEIFWRPSGERAWHPWDGAGGVFGLIDIAWRDGPFTRDRRKAFLLSPGSELRRRSERDVIVYELSGFAGTRVSAAENGLELETQPGGALRARFLGRPRNRASLLLTDARGASCRAEARYPFGCGIASWAGDLASPWGGRASRALSLKEVASSVAFSNGRQVLRARVVDRSGTAVPGGETSWSFEDELPLRGVASDLASLMLPCADINVQAELTFDGTGERWRIALFENTFRSETTDLWSIQGATIEAGTVLSGRPVFDPWAETTLTPVEKLGVVTSTQLGSILGTWIVYLRRGAEILSRPSILASGPAELQPPSGLRRAFAVQDTAERERAILACFDAIGSGEEGSEADLKLLIQTCISLNGVPPGSLDALRLLPNRPAVAARLLLEVGPDGRDTVLTLPSSLPFDWYLVPVSCWVQAADLLRATLTDRLSSVAGVERASKLAGETLALTAAQLTGRGLLLGWPLFAAQVTRTPPVRRLLKLKSAANDHIQRHGDASAGQGSLFRSMRLDLPAELLDFDSSHLETLDAPCAAAAAAAGLTILTEAAIRRIKTAARVDPIYFAQAFDAWFFELMNNRPT